MIKGTDLKIIISSFALGIFSFIPPSLIAAIAIFTIGPLYAAIPIVGFLLTSIPLSKNNLKFHYYELIIPAIVTPLSIYWFSASWEYGLKYQGQVFLAVAILINIILLCSICSLFWYGRTNPSFNKRWVYIWLLWYWPITWAFVYLGEFC